MPRHLARIARLPSKGRDERPARPLTIGLRFGQAAALAVLVLLFSLPAQAQRRQGGGPLETLGSDDVDQREGWQILQRFRALGIAGDYRLRFQLQVMPRREKTRRVSGVLLGSMSERGPITRVDIVLQEAELDPAGKMVPAHVKRLLLQNGLSAYALEADSAAADPMPEAVPSDRFFEPIADSDFTIFDLLMPYMYWQNFSYQGRTTLRGRPTHVFLLYPPSEDELMQQSVSQVRVYIDEEVNALVQAEVFNASRELAKTVSIGAFKKVEGQWMIDQIDARNEITRDKTRFKVISAELNLDLPLGMFEAQSLTENISGKPKESHSPAKAEME